MLKTAGISGWVQTLQTLPASSMILTSVRVPRVVASVTKSSVLPVRRWFMQHAYVRLFRWAISVDTPLKMQMIKAPKTQPGITGSIREDCKANVDNVARGFLLISVERNSLESAVLGVNAQ
jgi:hypothetical protein